MLNRISKVLLPGAVLGAVALLGTPAQANTSTFIVSGEAQAVITTSLNAVKIQLTDLYVNPNSVKDNLSAFTFSLNTTPTSASVSSSSAQEVRVNDSGQYTLGSVVSPGWALSLLSARTTLDDLVGPGHSGPAETIIGAPGSGGYTNAAGSIAGNHPHNPFLDETATFTLTETGVTASTSVTSAIFQFGTTDGQNQVAGAISVSSNALVATPEPSTFALIGCAGVLLALGKKRLAAARG
jgi:hypothetical protein